ncbi:hypothetical protein DNTS_023527 [Danionella cerebrum]|uniref:Cilia- and flagella-associated protein 263 n=1 Tax=Danionella cerebrum TaxID=2873325 RepID=A0A553R7B7_9TELE|nr:hypothetical protein DNTS_023527 [Danionella translucida]
MAEMATEPKHLAELVKNLKCSNALIQAEIDLFEQFISRLDPQTVKAPSEKTLLSPGRKAKIRSTEKQLFLTPEQKCDVAQNIYKLVTDDLKRAGKRSEKLLEYYKATLEEADIHLKEIKKERSQFDCDIVKATEDKKSMKMSAEKITKYTEDKIKAKDNLIEKLQRKNAALHSYKKKLQIQLKQQEEMAEGLTELDFEQLKFENIHFRKRMDEQNLNHLNLKLLAGKTLQILNYNKEKLQTLTNESDMLNSDIALRMKLLVKLEEETKLAVEERNKAEALNKKLRGQLADFHVPHVLQYIEVKDSHGHLQKSVREWDRKVEIAEMALKTYMKSWEKLRIAAGVRPVHTQREAVDGF